MRVIKDYVMCTLKIMTVKHFTSVGAHILRLRLGNLPYIFNAD